MSIWIDPNSVAWLAFAALAAYAIGKIDWKAAFPRREQEK